ncbi:hypothetical protein HDU77_008440 [Chytriomyces hyalinus]|nr:hypothetical protein HDU77_008440 [Chytriomyces hyalinus]
MTTIDIDHAAAPLLSDEDDEQQMQPGIAAVLEREICLGAPLFLAESSDVVRNEFVRRIYIILAMQAASIWVISILLAESDLVADVLAHYPWIVSVLCASGLVVSALMHRVRGNEPSNGPLLVAYTMFEAHAICLAVLSFEGLEPAFHHALVLAFYWCLFMALYTFQSVFRFHGGYPLVYGTVVLFGILLASTHLFGMPIDRLAYVESILCIVSIVVVYDKLMRFTPYDYVIAVADICTFMFPIANLWFLLKGTRYFGGGADEAEV